MVVLCDRCNNRFAPDPDLEGHTTRCPVCGADLYIPNFVGAGQNSSDGPVMPLPSAPQPITADHADGTALAQEGGAARFVHIDGFWLAVGGWALLLTGLLIRFFITPTTIILSWIAVFLAIAAGIILFVRRHRRAASALVIAGILLPTVQSLLFWHYVGQEADRIDRQNEAAIEAITEKMGALLNQQALSPPPIMVHPQPQPIIMPVLPPRVAAPVQPAVDWGAARRQVKVAGIAVKNGTTFAVVNGEPMPHGSTVRAVLANREYNWRIIIDGQTVRLDPLTYRSLH